MKWLLSLAITLLLSTACGNAIQEITPATAELQGSVVKVVPEPTSVSTSTTVPTILPPNTPVSTMPPTDKPEPTPRPSNTAIPHTPTVSASNIAPTALPVNTRKPTATAIPTVLPTATAILIKDSNLTPQPISPKPPKPGGRPEDRYSCVINSKGYCIFSGNPHRTGLNPNTENIVDRKGNFLFLLQEAVAVNSSGEILKARGTPAFDGDELIKHSRNTMTGDEKAFHQVMAIMFPIRNALMYDIPELDQSTWDKLVYELEKRGIKDKTFTDGATPRDNYYGRQGIFDLAKNPKGKDIHHDVMKFLEESGLYLLCHVTSDEFGQMLKNNHPEGHDPCKDAGITSKIPF